MVKVFCPAKTCNYNNDGECLKEFIILQWYKNELIDAFNCYSYEVKK